MSLDLKPYPAYKDSGEKWLGQVPEQWGVVPLCAVAKPKSIAGKQDRELLSVYLDRGVIRFSDVEAKRTNVTSEDLSKYQAVDPGDFVLNNQQAWRGSVGVSAHTGIVSPAYLVLSLDSKFQPEFANLLFRERAMVSQYLICSKGVGSIQRNLYWPYLKRVSTVAPPLVEQYAIVRFLDHSDRLIRRYISVKLKLKKLLEEQKQAIIHRAVTRGFDPDAHLKPSGVEWLGDVPEHWEVLRGKYVGRLFSTPSVSDDDLTENGDSHPMYLKVSDLACTDNALRLKQSKLYVKSKKVETLERNTPRLVFPKRGGAIYTNKVGIIETDCLLDPNLMGWEISERFEPLYVALLLKTRTLADLADVSSVPQLNNKHINPILFPAPPRLEQATILARLERDLVGINKAISRTQNGISLLREYRTRLISEVVTGKLDVREAAARLPDETVEPEFENPEELFDEPRDENAEMEELTEEALE
jgi:type I restriction enzyme S subunit